MSTEDHYAEFDPNDPSNFNMARRANQGAGGIGSSRIHLTSTDGFVDEEMNIGMDDNSNDINIDEFSNTDSEGVSETLLAWRHIESWTTEHNPDLNASLGDPCTENDITHAEEDLAITFPASVKVSLRIHDGQEDLESMTGVSGLIYGLQLMTLDQIVEMTEKWRSVAKNMNKRSRIPSPTITPSQPTSSSSTEAADARRKKLHRTGISMEVADDIRRRQFKMSHIPTQASIPRNAIQPVYAHPAWIPLVTDNAGNHIGVDLAPAEAGKYAQVIVFGRDFDTKFVIAANWGEFLLSFANDLEAGNWYLIDDSDDFLAGDGDLVFRDKKSNGPAQDYFEVLKRRAWFKSKASEEKSSEVPTETASTDATTIAESSKDQEPLKEKPVGNQSHESLSGRDQESQVNNAITETELRSKDLKIPTLEITNESQVSQKDSKKEATVDVVEELSEQREPAAEQEQGAKGLATAVENKLKIQDDENGANVSEPVEHTKEEENLSENKIEQNTDKKATSPHKEEFESVTL